MIPKLHIIALTCIISSSVQTALATERVNLTHEVSGAKERLNATTDITVNSLGNRVSYHTKTTDASFSTLHLNRLDKHIPTSQRSEVIVKSTEGNDFPLHRSGPTSMSSSGRYIAFNNIGGSLAYDGNSRLISHAKDNGGQVFILDTNANDNNLLQIPNSFELGKNAFDDFERFVLLSSADQTELTLFNINTQNIVTSFMASATEFSLSKGGGAIVFRTNSGFVFEDTEHDSDVYVYDRSTSSYELISVSSEGIKATDDTIANTGADVAISSNGRFVAFTSESELVSGTNGQRHVYIRDRVLRTTELVSQSTTGVIGACTNDNAVVCNSRPVISDDGRYVAFISHSDQLDFDINGQIADAFLWDRQLQTTQLISYQDQGNFFGDKNVLEVAINADASEVTFITASDLHPDLHDRQQPIDTNQVTDAYRIQTHLFNKNNY